MSSCLSSGLSLRTLQRLDVLLRSHGDDSRRVDLSVGVVVVLLDVCPLAEA